MLIPSVSWALLWPTSVRPGSVLVSPQCQIGCGLLCATGVVTYTSNIRHSVDTMTNERGYHRGKSVFCVLLKRPIGFKSWFGEACPVEVAELAYPSAR